MVVMAPPLRIGMLFREQKPGSSRPHCAPRVQLRQGRCRIEEPTAEPAELSDDLGAERVDVLSPSDPLDLIGKRADYRHLRSESAQPRLGGERSIVGGPESYDRADVRRHEPTVSNLEAIVCGRRGRPENARQGNWRADSAPCTVRKSHSLRKITADADPFHRPSYRFSFS
jgi:hypothetical protein